MREYKKFRLTIRMIEALAFDPVEDTIETLPFSFSLSLSLSLSLSEFVMEPVLVILDYIQSWTKYP